ncbi:NADH dehydrogenase [ubiquinone] 1 alpha subcomplex assembly factor 2 isoform X2 [Elgaria multicarinata webbii]|uniref:NADH dehydrogenase [ubiquinone] 1 alpha subcomplex assembly factor 2 isoform X2 n=1 Tax=Elgaria multicarinata webbii TaxID=159646 RepID=UPI002FCCF379
MSGVWRLLRSLKLRALGPAKEYVGTDPSGNKYYRIPKHETWAAWIRKKRKDPPTNEEILQNEEYKDNIKRRAEEVSEKERLLQAKEYEEGLVAEPLQTQIKGHASAHHYGKNEPSEEPVSTANTFQPGAWMPRQDSARNK